MEKTLVKRANSAFNRGEYEAAKGLYQSAAKQYGESLFSINIWLCEKSFQTGKSKAKPRVSGFIESVESKKMSEQIASLKNQLREKDANINERFEELAILTRMLEERDNSASA